jgi:hypothetical protein
MVVGIRMALFLFLSPLLIRVWWKLLWSGATENASTNDLFADSKINTKTATNAIATRSIVDTFFKAMFALNLDVAVVFTGYPFVFLLQRCIYIFCSKQNLNHR